VYAKIIIYIVAFEGQERVSRVMLMEILEFLIVPGTMIDTN